MRVVLIRHAAERLFGQRQISRSDRVQRFVANRWRRLFLVRKNDRIHREMAIPLAVGNLEMTNLIDLLFERDRFPAQCAVAIARHALGIPARRENSNRQQRRLFTHRLELSARQSHVDVLLHRHEAARNQYAGQLVRHLPRRIEHAGRLPAKRRARPVPSRQLGIVEIVEHLVAGAQRNRGQPLGRRTRNAANNLLAAPRQFRRFDRAQRGPRAVDNAAERVVVGRRDRIEFVIVASRARNRQS